MSSRADRLQPAVDQALKRREDAMQKLAEQQQRLTRAEQQLADLSRYRADYVGGDGDAAGVSVTTLINRQQFVDRIDQAISQQNHEIERQRRQLDLARGQWRAAHARERALDSVVDGYRQQERKAEDRREQSEVDERMQHRGGSLLGRSK